MPQRVTHILCKRLPGAWRKATAGQALCYLLLSGLLLFGLAACRWPGELASQDPASVASQQAREQAERLYDSAWQMIRNEYVDGTFNGQDWSAWRTHYRGRLQDVDDAHVAIQTMIASLDDAYTRYLKPREMQEQNISIDSKLYGIGIQISMKDGKLVVVNTFEDTPAFRAGLLPQDVISKINDKDTAGMDVSDAADLIRGPQGTTVTLTIVRGKQTFNRTIARAEIRIKSVFTKELPDKRIGYIRLSSFISQDEMDEMYRAAEQMKSKQAIVFDLRGNYGGLLSNAVEVADMFMDKGTIVSMVDRDRRRRSFDAERGTVLDQPVVVLVDGGTASASEIVSGALKDNKRAVLIGTQTFGKGLVQKIVPLYDGSGMNITISKYFTPNGTDINKKGIAPTIEVTMTHADFFKGKDPQLDRAVTYLKENYLAADKPKTASATGAR